MKILILMTTILLSFSSFANELKLNIKYDNTLSQDQKDFVTEELTEMIRIMKSEQFQLDVSLHEYEGKEQFAKNKNLTNDEIFEAIMNGAEFGSSSDGEIDLEVRGYQSSFPGNRCDNGVPNCSDRLLSYSVGSTVYINKRYIRQKDKRIGSTIIGSWIEMLGFEAEHRYTKPEHHFTVPGGIRKILRLNYERPLAYSLQCFIFDPKTKTQIDLPIGVYESAEVTVYRGSEFQVRYQRGDKFKQERLWMNFDEHEFVMTSPSQEILDSGLVHKIRYKKLVFVCHQD